MFLRSKTTKAFLVEVFKVLAICTAFYLLQTQIFQVRYDVYGRTSGLAQAQARTKSELGDTRKFIQLAIEDSALELARAQEALEGSVRTLREEREGLIHLIEERTRQVASGLHDILETDREEIKSLEVKSQANALLLENLKLTFLKDVERMKRSMIFPTVQLRGNGTVGSGVLIYSRRQPGVSAAPIHATFVLTACHVVEEVLGEPLEKGKEIDHLRIMKGDHPDASDVLAARLVLFDVDRDIALMRVNSQSRVAHMATLLPLSEFERLDVFSPAYAVGCPLGNRPMPTLGEISSKSKVVGDQTFWMLNAPTFFGNSGGGIYQTPKYQLIGVSSMIYTYGKRNPTVVPHMGLFVPLDTIYAWLEDEGFRFVVEGRAIPRHLREELIYLQEGEAFPSPAAAVGSESPREPPEEDL